MRRPGMVFAMILHPHVRETDSAEQRTRQLHVVAHLIADRAFLRSVHRPTDEEEHEEREQDYAEFVHVAVDVVAGGISPSPLDDYQLMRCRCA